MMEQKYEVFIEWLMQTYNFIESAKIATTPRGEVSVIAVFTPRPKDLDRDIKTLFDIVSAARYLHTDTYIDFYYIIYLIEEILLPEKNKSTDKAIEPTFAIMRVDSVYLIQYILGTVTLGILKSKIDDNIFKF